MAKYDVLHEFKERLGREEGLSDNTKLQYYKFTKKVLQDLNFSNPEDIQPEQVLMNVSKLKTKNDVSAAKRGLEFFSSYYPEFQLHSQIKEVSLKKRNRKKRTWQPLDLNAVKKTINALHDEKLRLAYRSMLETGMRVSEVECLRKKDIKIDGNTIRFYLQHTKKGCEDEVFCSSDYLATKLTSYLEKFEEEEKLFYSKSMMMKKAGEHGFECHDLRRAYAKNEYRSARQSVNSYEAVDIVRDKLRHESCRTTKKYLRRVIR